MFGLFHISLYMSCFLEAKEEKEAAKEEKETKEEGEPGVIGARLPPRAGSCGLRTKAKSKGSDKGKGSGKSKGTVKGKKRAIGAKDTTPTCKHQTQAQHTHHRLTHTQPTPRGLRRASSEAGSAR